MTSYRVPTSNATDSRAEQFRKYLENGGVLQAVQMVLVDMYEKNERPEKPLEYFKKCLAATSPEVRELESLHNEVNLLSMQLEQMKLENQSLREQLKENCKEPQEANSV